MKWYCLICLALLCLSCGPRVSSMCYFGSSFLKKVDRSDFMKLEQSGIVEQANKTLENTDMIFLINSKSKFN